MSTISGPASRTQSAPGRIRTCGPRIRSPLLYPAELRALDEGIHCTAVPQRGAILPLLSFPGKQFRSKPRGPSPLPNACLSPRFTPSPLLTNYGTFRGGSGGSTMAAGSTFRSGGEESGVKPVPRIGWPSQAGGDFSARGTAGGGPCSTGGFDWGVGGASAGRGATGGVSSGFFRLGSGSFADSDGGGAAGPTPGIGPGVEMGPRTTGGSSGSYRPPGAVGPGGGTVLAPGSGGSEGGSEGGFPAGTGGSGGSVISPPTGGAGGAHPTGNTGISFFPSDS